MNDVNDALTMSGLSFEDIQAQADMAGVSLKAYMIWPSVRLGNQKVPLNDLRQVMIKHDDVPNDWAPERINDVTAFLDCVQTLKYSTQLEEKFEYDPETIPFTEDEHEEYSAKRLKLSKHDEIPVKFHVSHVVKQVEEVTNDEGEVVDREVKTVEYDDGMQIWLRRTDGTPETDDDGGSEWSIMTRFNIAIRANFNQLPDFIATLCDLYDQDVFGSVDALIKRATR